jgi:hypothetical protein
MQSSPNMPVSFAMQSEMRSGHIMIEIVAEEIGFA